MFHHDQFLDERVIRDDAQAERLGALGDRARDVAERDQAERLAHQARNVQQRRAAFAPLALAHHAILLDGAAEGGQQQHHRVVGDFLDERIGAVGHRDAALGGSLHVDAVHADAAQDDAATPLRQAVDDLLGDADALRIDGIGILGELDEAVLVGGAFDDLGVDAFQRLHLQVVAAAGDGEAGARGRRDLELGQVSSPPNASADARAPPSRSRRCPSRDLSATRTRRSRSSAR